MKLYKTTTLLALSVLLCSVLDASATEFLYEQAYGGFNGSMTSIEGVNQQSVADDFTASADWLITEVRWVGRVGGSGSAATRPFLIDFFADAGSTPVETRPASISVTVNASQIASPYLGNNFTYNFTAFLTAPVAVSQGTTMWISITDNDVSRNGSNGMFWAKTAGDGLVYRSGDSGAWISYTDSVAFTLSGEVVPEPASMCLLAMGGLAMLRRR